MNYTELEAKMDDVKSEMKSSERMEKYFAGEEVDHIPFNLLADPLTLCDIYGYTTSQLIKDFELYAEVVEKAINDSYIEGVGVGLGLRTLGAAMGSTLHYPEHGIDNIEEYILQDYNEWDKMRDPEKLKELIALGVDNSLRWVEAFTKEIGKAPASISDPVTCTDLLSKKQFEEFSLPELKRLASGLKEITGSSPSIHICGHTKGLWPYLKEIGVSSFSVDNCEDLAELREEIGHEMTIVGNIPPVDILKNGSIEEVIESVKECIKKGATSPKGYILSSGCGLPIGTPKENLDAYLYAARKYGAGGEIGKLPKGMSL